MPSRLSCPWWTTITVLPWATFGLSDLVTTRTDLSKLINGNVSTVTFVPTSCSSSSAVTS